MISQTCCCTTCNFTSERIAWKAAQVTALCTVSFAAFTGLGVFFAEYVFKEKKIAFLCMVIPAIPTVFCGITLLGCIITALFLKITNER